MATKEPTAPPHKAQEASNRSRSRNRGFWNSLPGMITKITALVVALTGLVAGLRQLYTSHRSPNSTTVAATTPPPSDTASHRHHSSTSVTPSAIEILTSGTWKLRVNYKANEGSGWSDYHQDIEFKFEPSVRALVVWRVSAGEHQGSASDVTIDNKTGRTVVPLSFERSDLRNIESRVSCSRALDSPHNALFKLEFSPSKELLDGSVWVAHPDVGEPYICGRAQFLAHNQ